MGTTREAPRIRKEIKPHAIFLSSKRKGLKPVGVVEVSEIQGNQRPHANPKDKNRDTGEDTEERTVKRKDRESLPKAQNQCPYGQGFDGIDEIDR
ncbi:hypothetical protein FGG08_007596 [Glutinoglossum americanum]|uniref:Uncharacterized protein n=1 Tax=Glutinoglossum americanum TaxID=1670608 RepID=A0A9P8I130_9PEZI|nr:hypothetical protein FGG08_007596 [Glutinoglossum americanum]